MKITILYAVYKEVKINLMDFYAFYQRQLAIIIESSKLQCFFISGFLRVIYADKGAIS
jgi:hypothetical protein